MANLITIEDVVIALGREPMDDTEEAQWKTTIKKISAFINGYVDVSFTPATDTVRYHSDYYGVVQLGGDPISAVTSVADRSGMDISAAMWSDGDDVIYGLLPNAVVDVTYTHGMSAVPDDVAVLVLDAVVGVLGLGSNGPLKSFTLGDKTEAYASDSGSGMVTVQLEQRVLDNYRQTLTTLTLGPSLPQYGTMIPWS